MVFPNRTWAIRVIEKAGFPVRSKEATVLIDMLILGGRTGCYGGFSIGPDPSPSPDTGLPQVIATGIFSTSEPDSQMPVPDGVLFSAMRMVYSHTAIERLMKELAVSPMEAENVLGKLPKAAVAVATEHGMIDFVKWARIIDMLP